jgi:zinc transport system substrate-binding protein
VVSHDAFGYLEKYGLHLAGVAGLSPDAEPTPANLADLHELIQDEGITTVFSERLASPRFTEPLADDLGIKTEVLDPIEGLTDETSEEDYLSLMEQNLDALREANGCR